MSGIILYRSKYGASKKYAGWISEETGFEMIETKKADINKTAGYDTVILVGGIYAMGIAGLSYLKKNLGKLKDKKIYVLCCGASPYEEEAFRQIKDFNMKGELAGIPCFYGRGAWDKDAMSFKDRTLCNMLRKAVNKKDPADLEIWEKALVEAGEEKCDWTDRKYLEPLLTCVRSN